MILDTSAFAPASAEVAPPAMLEGLVYDNEGLAVPPPYDGSLRGWYKLPARYRQQRSEQYLSKLASEKPKKVRAYRPGATRFTTDYAIKWGRGQGWKLLERERYDFRNKRHSDLEGVTDAIFDELVRDGRTGVQGAGKGEEAEHYAKFQAWGGEEKALRRHLRVVYTEFVRGNYEPIKVVWWA